MERRCKLVVFWLEVGGRIDAETIKLLRDVARTGCCARAGGAGKASWVHQRGHGLQVKHGKTLTLSFFGHTISEVPTAELAGDPQPATAK